MLDRVFDYINVARRYQDSKGEKELVEYTATDDWRF